MQKIPLAAGFFISCQDVFDSRHPEAKPKDPVNISCLFNIKFDWIGLMSQLFGSVIKKSFSFLQHSPSELSSPLLGSE
jgi:hypothetical protein